MRVPGESKSADNIVDSKRTAEFAFDLQVGLARHDVPEFDALKELGMVASLAVHIRGLGEIPYEVLRKVSDYYFDIPSAALKPVLEVLAEIEFVRLVQREKRIVTVIPEVPQFEDVYGILGDYSAAEQTLNEHEQATLAILMELYNKPENRERLLNTTAIETPVFDRVIRIGETGGLVRSHRARGRTILVSPFYFADNLDALADLAARSGSEAIERVLNVVRRNQGWPLSLIDARAEIGGNKLSASDRQLLRTLSKEGILKPPTIEFGKNSERFVFTPRPGDARLNVAKRQIYERAMALVSAVRKGQLLADQFKIWSPLAILRALRSRGYLRENSEAATQYRNLVVMQVCKLVETRPGRWELHLVDTDENNEALDLAISLLSTGDLADMEVNQEARLALTKDEKYIQSIIAAADMRQREKEKIDRQTAEQLELLLLKMD